MGEQASTTEFTTEFDDGWVVIRAGDATIARASPESVVFICPSCGSITADANDPACAECGSDIVVESAYRPVDL